MSENEIEYCCDHHKQLAQVAEHMMGSYLQAKQGIFGTGHPALAELATLFGRIVELETEASYERAQEALDVYKAKCDKSL